MSEPIVKRRPMIDLEEFERRLRKPVTASPRDDDPLAELARSFAGEEVDPYKTVFEPLNRRPSGAWRNEQDRGDGRVQAGRQPLIGGDFAEIEAGLLGTARYDNSESLSAPDEVESYLQEGQEHWLYAGTEAPHEADPGYEEVRSRRPLYVMAAMIVAGIAGIGASFGLKGTVSNPAEIATIKAAEGPTKILPETVASTETPDRNATVLGGTPQPLPVAVVNNAEQPADLAAQVNAPQGGGDPSNAVASLATGAASVPVPAPPAQQEAQVQPQPPVDSIAALLEPKKVKTVAVRPDGTLVPDDAPPQVEPAARHIAAAPKPVPRVAATSKAPNARAEAEKTSIAIAHKDRGLQVADAQDRAPGVEAARQTPGSFAVQLAAPATEREARATQVRLMKKFGAELTGFHPSIHKAEVGGKSVYRVRVSGLSSREEATALCEKIQGSGGRCFVARN
jgi:hypothetical protein